MSTEADFSLRGTDRNFVTGREVKFNENEIIVSKTDTRGIMVYVNDVFLKISGYTEDEMLGKPHSAIRHPHMPKCVFKVLWDAIKSGNEVFAYVQNRCKNGDHYWVLAHVTPTLNDKGEVIGYHSSRRVPKREALAKVEPLYKELLDIEKKQGGSKNGMEASYAYLMDMIKSKGISYDNFILSL